MSYSLFSHGGGLFLLRYFHVLAGIVWIGHLYYFNFVQGAFFAETDAATKSNAIQKLVPRALWWFRWGAMITMITGVLLYMGNGNYIPNNSPALTITLGMALGLVMWFNVWFVIWPNQKIVIQSATQVAQGGQALPTAAAAAAKAGLASRHNVLFSIPMLFFMLGAQHLGIAVNPEYNMGVFFGIFFAILGALEFNALKGKLGPLTTVKGVIHMGLFLTVVFYLMLEILTK
ncbi:MAG: urate hydroxylase PuuD [Oligoflexia bacterium]|nr:urate hydroxylase PuuD [Oligoflexia bacterium]